MEEVKCPCEGNNLDKLIHPAILTVLAQEDLYGYKIVQRIAETPMFNGQKPDGTGVYRILKSMEKQGLVVSFWNLADTGPVKRIYQLTGAGEECLLRWVETLKEYRDTIGAMLEEAQKVNAKYVRDSADNL